jgi:hypothetical protein
MGLDLIKVAKDPLNLWYKETVRHEEGICIGLGTHTYIVQKP